jgi:hypothetical protein
LVKGTSNIGLNQKHTYVFLGKQFYEAKSHGIDSMAATVIHELSHAICGTGDVDFASLTGSVTGQVLTVKDVTFGTIGPDMIILGTGVVGGTQIISQLSGAAGGVGTYKVSKSYPQPISGTYVIPTYGVTLCEQMAASRPKDAIKNTDNYEYLCEASWEEKEKVKLDLPKKAHLDIHMRQPK